MRPSARKVLGRAIVSYNELNTLVVEIEATLNDRPLTYASSELDSITPISPSMLLCGHRIVGVPTNVDETEIYDESYNPATTVNRRHVYLCSVLSRF